MNPHAPIAPMLVPLVAAALALALRSRPLAQTAVSVLGIGLYVGAVGALSWGVVFGPDAAAMVYQLGDWPAPYGITLVADALSVFVLVMIAAVGLASLLFSTRYVRDDDQRTFYHPFFHFLLLGATGAVLTGDLFNLFVWFEVMLMASYAFVAFYGGGLHTRASLRYVVLNVVASSVMLVAIGGLYAVTGTLNMADMTRRLAEPAAYGVDPAPAIGLSTLLFCVFALKAGLVPFQFWVPSAYRAAPLPVSAMLAGATKKVGIYAIVRFSFTIFATAEVTVDLPGVTGNDPLAFYGVFLFAFAAASILVGGLGALSADAVDEVLAYSSVGQVGFVALPLALGAAVTVPGVRQFAVLATLVYALNHALSKALLFLATGALRDSTGTTNLSELGGVAGRSPALSAVFLVGALSLVGIPPLSGFFGKFLAFDAALRAGSTPALGMLLGGTVLTIAYVTRTWSLGFWGERTQPVAQSVAVDRLQLAVLCGLGLGVVGVGVGFEPLYGFAEEAAAAALDGEAYVDLVDPERGGGS